MLSVVQTSSWHLTYSCGHFDLIMVTLLQYVLMKAILTENVLKVHGTELVNEFEVSLKRRWKDMRLKQGRLSLTYAEVTTLYFEIHRMGKDVWAMQGLCKDMDTADFTITGITDLFGSPWCAPRLIRLKRLCSLSIWWHLMASYSQTFI